MKQNQILVRNSPQKLTTRALRMEPKTYREADNSVEFILATEKPAKVWDWERWQEIDEVLSADGFKIYSGEQVPLLDSHDRSTVDNILGSVRDIRTEGDTVIGRLYFSETPEAKAALQKIREGHLTTGSAGYSQERTTLITAGSSLTYNGKLYEAKDQDLYLTTEWTLKEFSLVAVPADNGAVVRGNNGKNPENHINGKTAEGAKKMSEKGLNRNQRRAAAKLAAKEDTTPVQTIDTEAIRAQAIKEEQERAAMINELCTRHDCQALQAELIRSGASFADAQTKVLEAIETRKSVSVATPDVKIVAEEQDKKREMYVNNILVRAGVTKDHEANKGLGFADIARSCLQDRQIETYHMGKIDILTRAMSSSDFPLVLSNAANKSVLKGYQGAQETWKLWAKIGFNPDFKGGKRAGLTGISELKLNRPGEEIEFGMLGENGIDVGLETFARKVGITRQALINDDMGLFSDIFAMFGKKAGNQIERDVYRVLTANTQIIDGQVIFHNSHKNIATAVGAVSATTIAEAAALIKKQKDDFNEPCGLIARYILAGVENEVPAKLFCTSVTDPGTQASVNPLQGYIPVITPHIDGAGFFMAAEDHNLEVTFLDGKTTPTLYTLENQGDILGQTFIAYIDYGVKALDYRGLSKVKAS